MTTPAPPTDAVSVPGQAASLILYGLTNLAGTVGNLANEVRIYGGRHTLRQTGHLFEKAAREIEAVVSMVPVMMQAPQVLLDTLADHIEQEWEPFDDGTEIANQVIRDILVTIRGWARPTVTEEQA